MVKIIRIVCSVPKTIWLNFAFLPFLKALKLPIWVSFDTELKIKGRIRIDGDVKCAMIRVGFLQPLACCKETTRIHVKKGGTLIFQGEAHMGHGSRIIVRKNALLVMGRNFAISGNTAVNCYKHIVFGSDIQFSWNCLVMDSDTHVIMDTDNQPYNSEKKIVIGDHVWIGCNCTILKGTVIPSNTVIGACSLVSGHKFEHSSLIAGSPAKGIRSIGGWRL